MSNRPAAVFFIAGTKPKLTEEGRAPFACPVCRQNTTATTLRARTYVSLFFIPVLPLGGGTAFVRCDSCGSEFDADASGRPVVPPSVPSASPPPMNPAPMPPNRAAPWTPEGQPWACTRCHNVNAPTERACLRCGAPR